MKKKMVLVVSLLFCSAVFADLPDLKLPYSPGLSWRITTGYRGSSTHQGKDEYAIDFSVAGYADLGLPILSVADGIVSLVSNEQTGYGNMVDVDHGNGYVSRYAHLLLITVEEGDFVEQGGQLGLCGSTGFSDFPHLHFVLYHDGQSVPPEPMSGYNSFEDGESYFSDNEAINLRPVSLFVDGFQHDGTSQAIAGCFNRHGGIDGVGWPIDDGGGIYVHDWYSQDGQFHVTIQDFRNSNNEYFAIIDNPDLGQAFLLQGGFRWYYASQVDGPAFFGAPTTNELVWQYHPWVNGSFDTTQPMVTYKRQEFASGAYLLWQFGTSKVIAIDGTGGGFNIALIPGDGQTLTLWANALTTTSVYLTINPINGASEYRFYRNGQLVGSVPASSALEYTDSGLAPNTSYNYQASVIDAKI